MNNTEKESEKNISTKAPIVHYKTLKYYYQNPPLIGLTNLGNTDYMNASLQCLSNIEQLTNYFKYDSSIKEIIKNQPNSLTASYKLIIDKLWPSNDNHNIIFNNNRSYTPNDFNDQLSEINILFQGKTENNVRDFFSFIISKLNDELNKGDKNNNNFENYVDLANEQMVFDEFIKEFKRSNNSIISDLFYGITESKIKCSKCKITKYNFQINYFFAFILEEVLKFKLDELQKNNYIQNQKEKNIKIQLLNKNIIDIKDYFEYEQKIDIFSGDSMMYCSLCQKLSDSFFQTIFYTLPQILIIILYKRKHNNKIRLQFDELLDLKDYAKNGGIYELICVINHLGEYDSSGHFIAACKSPINNRWYRYNDAVVTNITNFKNDILDFGEPHVLFYKRQ